MIQASICTIGDEILIGQIVDTNSSHISKALGAIGVRTSHMVSIGDNAETIEKTLSEELTNNDIVIVTGGLGPTKDDITKASLARLSGSRSYVCNQAQLEIVTAILASRHLDVLDINKAQAMVPDTCEVIPNKLGTAPIMVFRFPEERFGHKSVLFSLPGVPHEALGALPEIIKDIRSHFELPDICHKTIMTYGIAESALSELISKWEDSLPEDMHLAYLPNLLTGVRLRLSIYGGSKEDNEARIEAEIAKLRPILGNLIYSEEDSNLQTALKKVLSGTGKTISTAESCTGGNIAHMITLVPGSSEYFLGSVVSYAVSVKENLLGVPAETIEKNGVVSSQVAEAMAEGVRKATGSTYAVATTGLAGPGGDEHYPEGTVWIGVAGPHGTVSEKRQYKNDRERNIERFTAAALHLLFSYIRED